MISRKLFLLPLLLLSACGTSSPPGGSSGAAESVVTVEGDYQALDGLPYEEFLAQAVTRLSLEPGRQNRAEFAAALDQKWKLQCEEICRIERN